MEDDYESDFDTTVTASTTPAKTTTLRTSPTKSITLPFSSSHHCFTRSYGGFRTPSSSASSNPGKKYQRSSFPDLLENLHSFTRHRTPMGFSKDDYAEKEENKGDKKKLTFGEEIRKRNESQWLRIEDVVKDTMERYDDYCKNLVIKNELQQKENNERNQKQIQTLLKIEEKKKRDNIKQSSYARIWNHHAKMRELGEKLYQEKVEKERVRRSRLKQKKAERPWNM